MATPPADSPDGDGSGSGLSAHPVLRFARAVDRAFDQLGDAPTWSMTPGEQREALLILDRLGARRAELELRVLVSADRNDVGADTGATSTAAWLADATRQTRQHCSAEVRLATELDDRFDVTRRALARGGVNVDQAEVIVKAVDALTRDHDDLPDDVQARAESHMLDLAQQFDAVTLRRLGKRLFEVVRPDAADAAEGEMLAREEERARRSASVSFHDNGDGTVDGHFRLPVCTPSC
jgi:hypothetical protein